MSLAEAAARYGPCANCRPPIPAAVPSHSPQATTPSSPAAALSAPASASTPVLITRTGQKYHREGCPTLRGGGIATTLGEAAAKYGACRVCNPPVLGGAAAISAPVLTSRSPTTATARSGRCQAVTKKGTQCSRNASAGSRYCWQHGG
jgi:hypothetical protein